MNAIPKTIVELCGHAGITSIHLAFSGGSDQGYLNVSTSPVDAEQDLLEAIENWAHDAFQYNGAGDGTDYGDDYIYDLAGNTVSHTEWTMERVDQPSGKCRMEVSHVPL